MTKSGIYKIINLINNKIYVGSAVCLNKRKRNHYNCLRNNNHQNRYLQNAFNKYGEENLIFNVIEYVKDKNELINREQYWIDYYKSYIRTNGYNISPTAGSCLGIKPGPVSEEIRAKIRATLLGKKHSDERKMNMSIARKGKRLSEETKKRISIACKKIQFTPEHRKSLSVAMTGRQLSEETKIKIRGENHPNSKINEKQVIAIKQMLNKKNNHKEIAQYLNIDISTIRNISANRIWKHVILD